jgi:hypothetical protein
VGVPVALAAPGIYWATAMSAVAHCFLGFDLYQDVDAEAVLTLTQDLETASAATGR